MDKKNKKLSDERYLNFLVEKGLDPEKRTIMLTGSIGGDDFSFEHINAALSLLEHKHSKKAINIKIYSYGGSYYETLAIIDRIRLSPCYTNTICYGAAMSGAAITLLSGNCRKMTQSSTLMLHKTSYGVIDSHDNIKDLVDQADRENRWMAEFVANNSNQTVDYWLDRLHKKDCYFSAAEALELGLIDKVV